MIGGEKHRWIVILACSWLILGKIFTVCSYALCQLFSYPAGCVILQTYWCIYDSRFSSPTSCKLMLSTLSEVQSIFIICVHVFSSSFALVPLMNWSGCQEFV